MTLPDLSPAGELTIGQVGIANLRVRSLDIERLAQEMRERIERAPAMFSGAAVVVDFGGLADAPSPTDAAALLEALRGAGVRPVALAYGSQDNQALAGTLGLPTLAKFRAQYERAGEASTPGAVAAPAPPPQSRGPAPPAPSTRAQPGLVLASPVRSGQQVYADGRDLTILGVVSPGAEVMADGSVHVYGALRGRALAGAQGDTSARIFCQSLQAELVAIAGHYIVAEEVPMALLGKPAQVWLEDAQVRIAALD